MDPVETQYVDRDGAALAYQVVGDGPIDTVNFFELILHLDLAWMDPDLHHNLERHASVARTAYFQRRGFGLSDRITYTPTVEQQADDVLAIMDAIGMRRATLAGTLGTCGAIALVAAQAPERVDALVMINPLAQGVQTAGELHGWTEAEAARYLEGYREAFDNWGSGQIIDMWDPAQGTVYNRRLMALLERSSATPAAARAYFDWITHIDIQDVLRSVQVPTRVLCVPDTPIAEDAVRYAADLIPNATFQLLPPALPGASIGQAIVPMVDAIAEVATGTTHSSDLDRFLGTVLFTDVVESTELLANVGDATYREMRSAHERLVRLAVTNGGGELVNVSGDGTLSVFDGPTKAVRCAQTISREAAEAGIEVRCGVHTGELERDGLNVTGMTVHIGARVGAAARPGEVLVSRTVHDLVVGSGLTFVSRGEHELKGIPGRWGLFAVEHAGDPSDSLPVEESLQTPLDKLALESARRVPGMSRAAMRMANALERRRARASSRR
jgi:class 3 adenylate cyclase/pimeloyl-ACP methyl ester carboxylesterase